jgi:flagellin-like hook-associated protein FlgL
VALASGGLQDTLVGDRVLTIDAAAGTVQLGTGTPVAIPSASNAAVTNYGVADENGAVVYLDFTGFDSTSSTVTLTGEASISLDQTNWTALDLNLTDLELSDPETGTILHLDTRRVVRATSELYNFDGGVNAFDAIQGMIEDLENIHDLTTPELQARLTSRLSDLDRNFENVQSAQGTLGSRAQRLESGAERLSDFEITLRGLVSDREDADLASVILEMTKAEQTLQVAQASGTRLLQTTLLDYLR